MQLLQPIYLYRGPTQVAYGRDLDDRRSREFRRPACAFRRGFGLLDLKQRETEPKDSHDESCNTETEARDVHESHSRPIVRLAYGLGSGSQTGTFPSLMAPGCLDQVPAHLLVALRTASSGNDNRPGPAALTLQPAHVASTATGFTGRFAIMRIAVAAALTTANMSRPAV